MSADEQRPPNATDEEWQAAKDAAARIETLTVAFIEAIGQGVLDYGTAILSITKQLEALALMRETSFGDVLVDVAAGREFERRMNAGEITFT